MSASRKSIFFQEGEAIRQHRLLLSLTKLYQVAMIKSMASNCQDSLVLLGVRA